jgi:hypothetical protein
MPKVVVKKPKVVVKTKGGGDEIKELRYRLGVHLDKLPEISYKQHLQECDMIINKLDLTDRGSVVHIEDGKIIDIILEKMKESNVLRIYKAIKSLRDEIRKEKEEDLNELFNPIRFCSRNTTERVFNTIIMSLKLTNKYDIIIVEVKDINDLRNSGIPDVLIPCLLKLKNELEEKYKVFTLLMKTKLLTLYEAKNVVNSLGISDPISFIYFCEKDIEYIDNKILSKKKKKKLWRWIKSYKLHLLKTKLNENFSNDITERIIIGIKKHLKKNTGRDVYSDLNRLFDKDFIPDRDIEPIIKNIKNRYGLIKLDLRSIENKTIRKKVAKIQDSFKDKNTEYILNIIEKAENPRLTKSLENPLDKLNAEIDELLASGSDYSSSKSSSYKSSSSSKS